MAQIGLSWPEMTLLGMNWPEIAPNWPVLARLGQICPNWIELELLGLEVKELVDKTVLEYMFLK